MSSTSGLPDFKTLVAIDVVSSVASACLVAPFVTMIDQAVTQNASKTATLMQSLRNSIGTLFSNPRQFLGGRAYIAVALVYSSTYIAANTTLTACERHQVDPTYWKLAITSAVNMGAGITKDSLFARWFGQQAAPAAAASTSGASSAPASSSTVAAAIKSAPAPTPAPAASIPLATWGLFVCRDVFTIGAGFVLPDMVSRAALTHRLVESKAVSDTVAQLTVPMAAQTILTPMHLLALDLYNRPARSLSDRAAFIRPLLRDSLGARMARVGVVYGIAGVGNKVCRNALREHFAGGGDGGAAAGARGSTEVTTSMLGAGRK